jgi:hypothetical protein
MEGMMSNRKNTGAAKSVAKAKPAVKSAGKPVVKPVANTAHNHSDLEQQILELKKELKLAMTVVDRLNSTSIEMSAKIETLSSKAVIVERDERVYHLLHKIVECTDYRSLRLFYKKLKLEKKLI